MLEGKLVNIRGDFVFDWNKIRGGGTSRKPKEVQFVIRDSVDMPLW
jgi:hypothetical protein